MINARNRIAFWLINAGIRAMPRRYRTQTFIYNCMLTNKIRVERDLEMKGGKLTKIPEPPEAPKAPSCICLECLIPVDKCKHKEKFSK